jgi:peptide deformylase
MAILPIRRLGDPVLREPARDVEAFDESLRALFRDMLDTMYDAPGVGLAAPQVGLSLRFFVYDANDGEGPGAMANPILSEAEGEQDDDEGCLSVPGLYYPTRRAMRIRATGRNLEGREISLVGEGLMARILQHETDHVNGMLFIDRLDDEARRQAMADIRNRELGDRLGGAAGRRRSRSG